MQNAFLAGVVVGLIAPMVGIYLVMKRLSLIADALSHISLTGIATGLWMQNQWLFAQSFHPLYIGMGFSMIGALFVERLRQIFRGYQEISIPIVMAGGVASGIVLINAADGFNVDIAGYLFGNILAVSNEELISTFITGLIVVGFVFLFYKELFAVSFDEEYASFSGIPRKWLHRLFVLMVALVIAVTIRIVGILLVSALMTLPVAISLQIAQSFRQAFIGAVLLSQIAVFTGLFAAYYLDLASGGVIVLVLIAILLFVIAGKWCYQRIRKFIG